PIRSHRNGWWCGVVDEVGDLLGGEGLVVEVEVVDGAVEGAVSAGFGAEGELEVVDRDGVRPGGGGFFLAVDVQPDGLAVVGGGDVHPGLAVGGVVGGRVDPVGVARGVLVEPGEYAPAGRQ